jgi:hypothetical protein
MPSITSYLQDGRLSDVLALIQVLAFDRDTYRSEGGLQEEFQRKPVTGDSWMAVAREHPEFFRVRNNPEKEPRVALLARYVLPKEQVAGGEEKKPPLEPDLVNKLLELAVDLHDKQSERSSRWRNIVLPVIIAAIAAGASVASAIIGLAKPAESGLSKVATPPASAVVAPAPK